MFENEVNSTDYIRQYGKPKRGRVEFSVTLHIENSFTTVYGNWFELYGTRQFKLGWHNGDWTVFQLSALTHIEAI